MLRFLTRTHWDSRGWQTGNVGKTGRNGRRGWQAPWPIITPNVTGRRSTGAGIHHNPTPGPADQKFLYGHIWVTLSLVMHHSLWGTIGLPLLAELHGRQRR